jgi:hypothetical protein
MMFEILVGFVVIVIACGVGWAFDKFMNTDSIDSEE